MSIFYKKSVKVRFAPSPTGFLHIGGLRTALYNYFFAKKNKGKFILRIEDTDRKRLVKGGVENIIKTLREVGIKYDEGPDIGGKNGPYAQSERLPIYKKYLEDLLLKGKAYYCFCEQETLVKEREEQQKSGETSRYSGTCLKLSKADVKKNIADGKSFVARLKVPEQGSTAFEDLVYGKIEFKNKEIDHQVLLKSDGFPTYHLANVIDDHLMGITHVIRGEEWLPSTPKHILIYKALGWLAPEFAHLPLLLNPDKSKLSKRQGDVAVEDYLQKGYLPEALLNFVALLGWNPRGDQEIYSLEELIKYFDIKSVNKSGAVFNSEKLYWLNGEYIRKMPIKELKEKVLPYLLESGLLKKQGREYVNADTEEAMDVKFLEKIVEVEQSRLKRLDEFPQNTFYFFKKELDYGVEDLVWKKSNKHQTRYNLKLLLSYLEKTSDSKFNNLKMLETDVRAFIEKEKLDNGSVLWPMRMSLSGLRMSPSPFELAFVLGKEKTCMRIQTAISKL